ncbi:sn-glycerol-3-phosphate transport system permease protein UgpA [Microbacterium hydrocarbonoxydans]|uniref:sn-glycerol-3-phosphate transport system permease protein UgpA n=1 Tax=Microbacterium hydrocarbonoxydans TaxID=273678 RepID=A0A0M2HNH6_9MICO|nr:sugar ABC transporter permease [Microbacterium hydrocarbonoxydans]KJL48292.1 sn-glycerol-3-phosphate transport system permease protein UgpA [Microbacterium hydrocarbonoxydans]
MTLVTAAPSSTASAAPPSTSRRPKAHRLAPYLFTTPAIVLYIVFTVIPVLYAIWLSVRAYRVPGGALGRKQEVFVGFENYVAVLQDDTYLAGFGRLFVYGIIAIPLTLGLALLFALLLDAPAVRAKRFSRTAIFIPYAVPGVVAALLWGFMYLPSTSPFSYLTKALGWGPIPFLDETGIYPSLANVAIWGGVGFNMIIIYTSLRGIPAEIYESARLDGATETQIAWRIKIPLVAPALVLTGFFSLIGTVQLYSEPATLRPMTSTISASWVPLMSIYRDAFGTDNLPQAAAASTLLAVGTVLISALVLHLVNRRRNGAQS